MIQARMTRIGIMPEKRDIISIILDRRQSGEEGGSLPAAIWMEDPTAIPIVSSIFPLAAIQTEVTCCE
jgi:hypothetical protein